MKSEDINSIEKELKKIYKKYFQWFKEQSKYLKYGVKTSHPFFINIKTQLGKGVTETNELDTILVYGQETYGYPSQNWVKHPVLKKANIGEVFIKKNSLNDAMKINEVCSKGFDFPEFKNYSVEQFDINNGTNIKAHFKGPFWHLLKNISIKKELIIWSNIVKFDIYREGNQKRRIKKGEIIKESREFFCKIHRKLILDEIKILSPSKVLFLSSPNENSSIYNEIIGELLNYNNIMEKNIRTGSITVLRIPFIQSYHPRRLNLEERKELIDLL